jgi:hypothetical protein
MSRPFFTRAIIDIEARTVITAVLSWSGVIFIRPLTPLEKIT